MDDTLRSCEATMKFSRRFSVHVSIARENYFIGISSGLSGATCLCANPSRCRGAGRALLLVAASVARVGA